MGARGEGEWADQPAGQDGQSSGTGKADRKGTHLTSTTGRTGAGHCEERVRKTANALRLSSFSQSK